MKKSDFYYELPPKLIAANPLAERSQSRLLVFDPNQGDHQHRRFGDLIDYLQAGDLLVLNDTKVIPARVMGQKATGGKVELLLERVLDETVALCHLGANKKLALETVIHVAGQPCLRVTAKERDLFRVQKLIDQSWMDFFEQHGAMPLPPYLNRQAEAADNNRYQTVYARHLGSVAAPTAGLHFDQALLERLQAKGVEQASVTLHVGAGTFQSMRVDDVKDHTMHSERVKVTASLCDQVKATRQRGGRVVAVGTTAVRSLETAAQHGEIAPYEGETQLFIYPGYSFHCVDALITNFHLPESTLLMLVSAFAGKERTLSAYREAVEHGYRFFSYGDAMFLPCPAKKICVLPTNKVHCTIP